MASQKYSLNQHAIETLFKWGKPVRSLSRKSSVHLYVLLLGYAT